MYYFHFRNNDADIYVSSPAFSQQGLIEASSKNYKLISMWTVNSEKTMVYHTIPNTRMHVQWEVEQDPGVLAIALMVMIDHTRFYTLSGVYLSYSF